MERRYDFLVVGSGVAGLFYALQVTERLPKARVAIITKKGETDSSTNRAQGGIAAVVAKTDSFEAHIEDTLQCGAGLCHRDVVQTIISGAPAVIEELMAYGVAFSGREDELHLGREGGHSANRVVHATDMTGREIERALLKAVRDRKDRIDIYRDHMVLELLTGSVGGHRLCAGAFVFSERHHTFDYFCAPVTLVATGGLGQVYFHTTNPKIATGDGMAAAYRAGVSIGNLEFIQFHPTALFSPGRWPFLISEAVRGEGGRLLSVDGRRLMEGVHPLGDLAPRDIVARAIDRELKRTGEEYVLLDISHRDADFIIDRFPNIYEQCLNKGFDITQRPIPVVPSAHYACGGVVSDVNGQTELPGLYVAGEVAFTGMHGANRLASNSLLEAVVLAKGAAGRSVEYYQGVDFPTSLPVDNPPSSSLTYPRQKILIAHDRRQLNRIMSDFVGIVRRTDHLVLAHERVRQILEGIEQYYLATPATYAIVELRNMATLAELIIRSAISRKESRGLHCLEDHPDPQTNFAHDTIIKGLNQDDQ
ncbi:MAG: L-aspartate oxidase [bacterium]